MSDLRAELVRHSAGIQDALNACGDPTPLEEVFRTVLEQEAFLWTWGDTGIIANVRDYPVAPGYRECLLWMAWGDKDVIEANLPVVEAWAMACGATHVTLLGRKGWERTFLTKSMGYVPTAVMYHKELR